MSFITDVMPKRPLHALGGLTAGAALHSGIGSLQGMIVSLGAPAGALFGGATYLAEQLTRPIFKEIKKCCGQESCLSFVVKGIEWLVPRLAGLAALAACGVAFGTWQAIALVVMNMALPVIAVFGFAMGSEFAESRNATCLKEVFGRIALGIATTFGLTGAPAILHEALGDESLKDLFIRDNLGIFGPYVERNSSSSGVSERDL